MSVVSAICLIIVGAICSFAQSSEPHADEHPYRQQIARMDRELSTVKNISQVDLSPDGSMLAWAVEDFQTGKGSIRVSTTAPPAEIKRITAGGGGAECVERFPVWSPDSKHLAFFSDCRSPGNEQLFTIERGQQAARQLTKLNGFVGRPEWSPNGRTIAFLFVDHATREPNPMAAIKSPTGVIDDQQKTEVQHIVLIDVESGKLHELTPSGLNAFEFDWAPDSKRLTYTAAPPPGDDNWYIAQLYVQGTDETLPRVVYKPKWQIAVPRWSPDGASIAFIEGLMSDQGGTGGEIYLLSVAGGGPPRNLTPDRPSSPCWLVWRSPQSILFSEYVGGSTAVSTLDVPSGKTSTLWTNGETISASADTESLSVASISNRGVFLTAVIRSAWSTPPEVWVGPIGDWRQISRENVHFQPAPAKAESVTWTSDSFRVQGWLLFPRNFDPAKKYPMIVSVHGGPAWIFTPGWAAADIDVDAFSEVGYFIFFPNPRGSFGQGERFTQANRRDWGFGDLRDTLTGVDAAIAHYPVDGDRVGITGWSFGGSTSMFAVTQTNRFRAAVAGAAACNLVSYYGENSIDQWMLPYFGASAYDDPAAYMRSSALTYVKQVKTPTLILAGELDGEAPPAQAFEFWHALKTFGVPTQLVVYANEGHAFVKHEDRVDLIERSLTWFMRYMPPR